jgi:HYR domain-containing protein
VQTHRLSFGTLALLAALGLAAPSAAQVNITIVGALGDLDGNGDGGAGEAAVVQAAAACWANRLGTNRNFTLTVAGGSLTGGGIGQGATSAVDGAGIPTAGALTMDNDGSTTYFVDPTPLVSSEFPNPDANSQWRLLGGTNVDLFSVVTHEIGHTLGWLCGGPAGCTGFTNPNYDALMNPAPGSFVVSATCVSPFPVAGQAQLAGCVRLVQGGGTPLNVSLRGDGLGTANQIVNELSHPGVSGDLMIGFYTTGARETQSIADLNMFAHAYGDTVNFPLTVNAGADIVSECNATGGSNVTLNGGGSNDPEGNAITYSWSCAGVALTGANTVTPAGFFTLGPTVTCRLDATDLAACPPDADTMTVRVRDTTAPVVTCPPNLTVECTETGGTPDTNATIAGFLAGSSATDVCDSTLTLSNDAPVFFGVSTTTPVSFFTQDDSGNPAQCTATVHVVDSTPPIIGSATAAPNVLWAPNHKMVPVGISVSVADVCDASLNCHIVSVASNESIDGQGDGHTAPDWVVTGPLTVDLRSERAGGGSGRIYTITVQCTDDSANSTTRTVQVAVAHDQS